MFVHLTKVMVVTLRACEVSAASLFATILSQSFTSGFLQVNVVVLQIHLFFHIFTFVATFMIDFFDDAFYIRFVGPDELLRAPAQRRTFLFLVLLS